VLEEIPDADVSVYHRAADAAVVNYREVFSSGALLLALSQGVPVLAPKESSAAELLRPGAGMLIADDEQLRRVLGTHTPTADARDAALANAREYPWSSTARRVICAYRGIDADYPS
jgi:hypothetical protein